MQPTYPGDPNGQDDPDPLAHAAANANPVSATNPNPPACSPQLRRPSNDASQNGTQCPANKLVITPCDADPERDDVRRHGQLHRPPGRARRRRRLDRGLVPRNTTPAGDGSFVTTEPVGTEAWMPLNNHPTAKPTYDFYDTVPLGKTAIATGELVGSHRPIGRQRAPDANFPAGSATWHWHSPEPIAELPRREQHRRLRPERAARPRAASSTTRRRPARSRPRQKATNKIVMDKQEDITNFQTQFNGPFPFTTDGVVVGIPSASFEEEMQTKITFVGGDRRSTPRSARSTTRTCTSGGATTSPRRTTT